LRRCRGLAAKRKWNFSAWDGIPFKKASPASKLWGKGGKPPLDWLYPYREGANAMPGRSSDPIGNAPQFKDVQCPVDQATHACQVLRCRSKKFELPVQDESEVRLHDLSVGLLQRSRAGERRKVGNVPTISVPGLDQLRVLMGGSFRATEKFSLPRFHKAVIQLAASDTQC
jgi:hypothetical protein